VTTELQFVWPPIDVNEDSNRLGYDTVLTSNCDVVYVGKKIKKIEMNKACSTNGEKKRCLGFCWGILRGKGHLEDLCVDGRKFLKQIFKKYYDEGVDRIYLAQDDDR